MRTCCLVTALSSSAVGLGLSQKVLGVLVIWSLFEVPKAIRKSSHSSSEGTCTLAMQADFALQLDKKREWSNFIHFMCFWCK